MQEYSRGAAASSPLHWEETDVWCVCGGGGLIDDYGRDEEKRWVRDTLWVNVYVFSFREP